MAETGLLTRFVPAGIKSSALYRWWLRFTRVLQFLSAIISLGIFSSRVYKVYRLVNSVKAQRGLDNASGAVEGILAAAVLYTIIATLMTCIFRGGKGPNWLRWVWVLLDIAFVGAFIAVSVITRPAGGSAGPRHCYRNNQNQQTNLDGTAANEDPTCNLPWGTFILAIISTLLHAITAAFHEVRDHHKHNKALKEGQSDYGMAENGHGAPANGHGTTGNGYGAAENGYGAATNGTRH